MREVPPSGSNSPTHLKNFHNPPFTEAQKALTTKSGNPEADNRHQNGVVATLDVGTSSVRASLYNLLGEPIPNAFSHRQHQPRVLEPGESTLDADVLIEGVLRCLQEVVAKSPAPVLAVGMATFWHSILGVDGDGNACTPVYLWSDTRSSEQVRTLRSQFNENAVHDRTGCVFHTSYLPARLLWIKETEPELFQSVAAWLSPGEYLYLSLFGERRCSLSMASGTGLLNEDTLKWDSELLEFLGLPAEKLSSLADVNSAFHGLRQPYADRFPTLKDVPWYPALGDGACSNLGSGGRDPASVTVMVGTSGAMRIMGNLNVPAPPGLWKYRLDRDRVLIGGALSNGGAVYHWLTNTLLLPSAEEVEISLRNAVPDSHGLTVLPFLQGERSPDWLPDATGSILGLTAGTTPFQVFQASLEAVAYRFMLVHERLAPLASPGYRLVGSGAALTHSPAWAQMLTDAIGRPMLLLQEGEGTSRGVALVLLEQLRVDALHGAASLPPGVMLTPDAERHKVYCRGLERHKDAVQRMGF